MVHKIHIIFVLLLLSFGVNASQIKFYGVIQGEYSVTDSFGGSSVQSVDDDSANSGIGQLGFKFTEKINQYLSSNAVLEFRTDPVNNAGASTNRQGYVELDHKKLGAIAIGRFHSIYKWTGGIQIDPLMGTALQARTNGGMSGGAGLLGHIGYVSNSIRYISPSFNNFKLSLLWMPDERNQNSISTAGNDKENDYALAFSFEKGPLNAWFVHGRDKRSGNVPSEMASKIGLQLALNQHKVSFQYEVISNSFNNAQLLNNFAAITDVNGSSDHDAEIVYLGYQYKLRNNLLVAQLGKTDVDGLNGNNVDYLALGLIHHMSRKVRVHFGYMNSQSSINADRDVWAVGLRKTF
ncbi:MAG: porin [Methylococcales bacterium]|jgi:predicted porin|nr:porin [Methylococcales bacterium]MBT7411127.1 porin [Methylococcales bacterium]